MDELGAPLAQAGGDQRAKAPLRRGAHLVALETDAADRDVIVVLVDHGGVVDINGGFAGKNHGVLGRRIHSSQDVVERLEQRER